MLVALTVCSCDCWGIRKKSFQFIKKIKEFIKKYRRAALNNNNPYEKSDSSFKDRNPPAPAEPVDHSHVSEGMPCWSENYASLVNMLKY